MPLPNLSGNTWYDSFQSANGTNMIGRTSDSGATYANATGQALVQMPITSNSPYSATNGSDAYAVASASLGINDPVAMLVTYNGSATGNHCGLLYRVQGSGAGYMVRFNNQCQLALYVIPSGGAIGGATAVFRPASAFSTGQYLIVAAPWYSTHDLYCIQQSTGFYFNPSTGSFQATPVPMVSVGDVTTLAGGQCGINQSYGSAASQPIAINQVSGGPVIFLPADLGCSLSADRLNVLTCLSARGGAVPISYALQRKTGAGAYATIASVTPGTPFVDAGVSASTTYDYQVVATDANSNTVTSGVVAATTTATQSITPYTPTVPASPITAWTNGTLPLDTTGAAGNWHDFAGFWDPLYGQYFGVGQQIIGSNLPTAFYAYFSSDLMNWTPGANNPIITVTQLNNDTSGGGTTWFSMTRPAIVQHPTDGHYYCGFRALNQAGNVLYLFIYKASAPMGPYSYVAGPILPPGNVSSGDQKLFKDYDGSIWWFTSAQPAVALLNAAMTAFTGNSNTASPFTFEGCAPYRYNRSVGNPASYPTLWAWNPNQLILFGSTVQYTSNGSGISNATATIWPNASMFTTPAAAIAAPAGAGPPTFADGYGGSGNPYSGGTATGIDPVATYAGQVCSTLVTASGQYILMMDRHDASGSAASTVVWLPMTFNTQGLPTVPFVASFVPAAAPPSTGGGAALIASM